MGRESQQDVLLKQAVSSSQQGVEKGKIQLINTGTLT